MAELGIDVLTGTGATSDDASASLTSAFEKKYPDEIAMSAVLNALLADYPYEMFWYDKTTSTSTRGPGSGASGNSSGWTARYSSGITISMPVASEYAVSTYEVDGDKITVVQSAADNAQAVVAGHAFDTDKAKLTAYRDYICDQTSYNDDAANKSTNTPYGNPWQLIWVFDNDSDTTVVCEGYAKAFKYLCDLSTFTSDKIDCILVSGVMTGGSAQIRYGEIAIIKGKGGASTASPYP